MAQRQPGLRSDRYWLSGRSHCWRHKAVRSPPRLASYRTSKWFSSSCPYCGIYAVWVMSCPLSLDSPSRVRPRIHCNRSVHFRSTRLSSLDSPSRVRLRRHCESIVTDPPIVARLSESSPTAMPLRINCNRPLSPFRILIQRPRQIVWAVAIVLAPPSRKMNKF